MNFSSLKSTMELFEHSNDVAHFTSVLRYPVFVNGKKYTCTPDPSRSELLSQELRHFSAEAQQLSSALFVPVGKLPNKVLRNLVSNGTVADKNVLFDIPHPSGANQERINYFLGQKLKENLSNRTNAEKIDHGRKVLEEKIRVCSAYMSRR